MKKVALSVLATVALAQAAPQPYKIFVETYSNGDDPGLEMTYKSVKKALKDYTDAKVLKRPSGKYHVVVVETIMEKNKVNELLAKVQSMPEHSDAFMLPAPELLDNQTQVAQKETINETPQEQAPQEERIELVEDVKPLERKEISKSISQKTMSLNEVVNNVLHTNPNIQQRIAFYMQVGKELDISKRDYYPTLDFIASLGIGKEKSKPSKDDSWQNNKTKQAELRLVENLYKGGLTQSNIKQSESRMKNASYLVLESADRTTLKTIDAYLELVKEKTLLDLSADNIKRLEAIYNKIKQRTDSGFSRISEKQQAASRLTLAKSNFVSEQNAYQDAIATLEKQIGIKIDSQELAYPEFSYALPNDLLTFEQTSLECNPAVRAEMANVQLAKEMYKGANAAFLPTIDLEAYAKLNDKSSDDIDNRIDSYGALLRFKYNLYNQGVDQLTKEKKQVGIQKEEQILGTIKRDLQESLKFSWQSYTLNKEKLAYLADHAKFSKETLSTYREEFEIGRRELINVLDAENEFYSARREIVKIEKDFMYSKYRILDNMGLLADSFSPGFGKKYVLDACSISSTK